VVTTTQEITVTQVVTSPTPTSVITPTAIVATSTPLPTATPYTSDAFEENFKVYMADINTFADLTEADMKWIFGMQLLREKVFDAITSDISREQDQVWTRHVVVSDEAQAQTVYDRLTGGEDFEAVATDVYSGTASLSPVDLGWFSLGTLELAAEQVVFNLQIGQISEPILTADGWEIYQVLGHEVRTLSDTDYDQLKLSEFQNWLEDQKIEQNVETFEIWKTRVPARPTIPPTQAQ
jgi:parvulin-like peptidyl-prolyl isomerase